MKISEKFDFLMDYLKIIGGGEHISFNNSVFLSERETADRNFALAYYMKENQSFPKGFILQETLDFYFQVSNRIQLLIPNLWILFLWIFKLAFDAKFISCSAHPVTNFMKQEFKELCFNFLNINSYIYWLYLLSKRKQKSGKFRICRFQNYNTIYYSYLV